MPSARCSTCGDSWPVMYSRCPKCEEPTRLFSNVEPDKDWHDKVKAAKEKIGATEPNVAENKVEAWRLDQFQRYGLDLERALMIAGNPRVDLARFRKMRDEGCSVDDAYEIVS